MPAPSEEQAATLLRRLGEPSDAARVEHWLGGFRRRLRRRRVARIAFAAMSLVAAVAVGAALLPGLKSPERAETAPANSGALMLADGSTLERGAGARVSVVEAGARRVRVSLAQGKIMANVSARPERQFVVEADPFRIVVVGTRFGVERDESHVRVHVERGTVRVLRGEALVQTLLAGEAAVFSRSPVPVPSQAAPPVIEKTRVATSAEPQKAAHGSDWRSLAQRSMYAEAYQLIQKAGPQAVADEVDDLLLAADAARLSGHPDAALPYLGRVLATHAGDARAPMAAFTQGRLLLDLGRAARAATAFESALSLGAQGSLRENALARTVEAHSRAGDGARAAAHAQKYVTEFPRGRWLASVRTYGGLDE